MRRRYKMAKKSVEVKAGTIGIQNIWPNNINVQNKLLEINEKRLVMEDQEIINLVSNKYIKIVDSMEAATEMAQRLEKEREAKKDGQQ
jgi:cytoplasmic iron level regulating protein YaaA (DUF328/UPF0246 family)